MFIRCAIAVILFGARILVHDRHGFRVRLRDFWCFFGSGVCSLLFFTVCYFRAIELTSLAVAAILLYTAPSFVMLMSLPLFGERFTGRKLAALAMSFAGCCLVSGLGSGETLGASRWPSRVRRCCAWCSASPYLICRTCSTPTG